MKKDGTPGPKESREIAIERLRCTVQEVNRLPDNVFGGDWCSYLFFDSDWIFDAKFAGRVKEILAAEGGHSACISDIDLIDGVQECGVNIFFFDEATDEQSYWRFLQGADVGAGWLFGVGRYGCISDSGRWCVYCEKRNEVAVIAFKDVGIWSVLSPIVCSFSAVPIDQAIAGSISYGFSSRAMSMEWKNTLRARYMCRTELAP